MSETLLPPGAIVPTDQTVAETGAEPLTQEQIEHINKLAIERGTAAAAAEAMGLLDA